MIVPVGVTECVTGIVAVNGDIRHICERIADRCGEFFRYVIVAIPHVQHGRAGDIRCFVEMFVNLCAVIGDGGVDLQSGGGKVCQGAAHAETGDAEFTVKAGLGFQVADQRGNVFDRFITVDHPPVPQAFFA
jgi:hypothetical protein